MECLVQLHFRFFILFQRTHLFNARICSIMFIKLHLQNLCVQVHLRLDIHRPLHQSYLSVLSFTCEFLECTRPLLIWQSLCLVAVVRMVSSFMIFKFSLVSNYFLSMFLSLFVGFIVLNYSFVLTVRTNPLFLTFKGLRE